MDLREQYDAQELERARLSLALRRGSRHETVLRETHPGRAVLAGVGVAALAVLVAGVVGLVRPRPPQGWDDPGRVVLDTGSGERFLVDRARVLHPLVNETSLRLAVAGGASGELAAVRSRFVRAAPRGGPVGRADVPVDLPALLPPAAATERCQVGDAAVVVAGAVPPAAPGGVALVRPGPSGAPYALLVGGRALPVPADVALSRLGYAPRQAVAVAPVVVERVPAGPALDAVEGLPPAPPDPAASPQAREGALLVGDRSGASYVVSRGVLRRLPGRTAVQLAFGPRPPAPQVVPDALLDTAPQGPPVTGRGVPASPPVLAPVPAGGALCVDDAGSVRALPGLPARAATETTSTPQGAGLLTPTGRGLLLATSPGAAERPSEQAPVLLVTEGRAWPVVSSSVLTALGYRPTDVQVVSEALAGLPPRSPALQPLELR